MGARHQQTVHRQRKRTHREAARTRVLRSLRAGALGLFLSGMIAACAIALALSNIAPPNTGAASDARARLDNNWVSLRSSAPADLLAAMRRTTMYQEVAASSQTRLGKALRTSTLGAPILVRAYRPTQGTPAAPDVWVAPVLAAGAHVIALLDFEYDRPRARIRAVSFAGPFVPTDPEFGRPFPQITPAVALERVQKTHQLNAAGGSQPLLVYFPANLHALNDPHNQFKWNGGGQFPDLAVWKVSASQGQDFLVGLDGVVYAAAELPLALGAGQ